MHEEGPTNEDESTNEAGECIVDDDDELAAGPVTFRGLIEAARSTFGGEVVAPRDDVIAFIDKLYRAACIVYDHEAEPRGFAGPVEERAAALALSIIMNMIGGFKLGNDIATGMYLDVLDEVERDIIHAHDTLVMKSTNPMTTSGLIIPCDAGTDLRAGPRRDPTKQASKHEEIENEW
ncbi:MAG: hypothetical protein GYA24_01380 [Candidatus Lokiarchaeota archaeon]|nr:hypothetical protein [Candidatus Lokiarchaeota archaeon]